MIHPVKAKLEQLILPYMISAERLKRQPFYLGYNLYSYSRDILAGFIGVGLSSPIMLLFAKGLGVESKQITDTNIAGVFQSISGPWKAIVVAALGLLIVLKVYVSRRDAERLATLARSCAKEFRAISTDLVATLGTTDPMPGVIEIQNKITAIVRRYQSEDAWPWSPFPKGIDRAVRGRTEELLHRYERNWENPVQSTPPDE